MCGKRYEKWLIRRFSNSRPALRWYLALINFIENVRNRLIESLYSDCIVDKILIKTNAELIRSNDYIYKIWMNRLIAATVILNALST